MRTSAHAAKGWPGRPILRVDLGAALHADLLIMATPWRVRSPTVHPGTSRNGHVWTAGTAHSALLSGRSSGSLRRPPHGSTGARAVQRHDGGLYEVVGRLGGGASDLSQIAALMAASSATCAVPKTCLAAVKTLSATCRASSVLLRLGDGTSAANITAHHALPPRTASYGMWPNHARASSRVCLSNAWYTDPVSLAASFSCPAGGFRSFRVFVTR